MTLPGFAGIILTIGVAADANIVIFERIKEEVRAGRSVRAAIATGYRKGFSTIVDANVVTMITAGVLFLVATGGVRGFALMLLLGTLISMFTAVLATRALLGVLARFRWFDNPSVHGRERPKIPRLAADRHRRQAAALVLDLRRADRRIGHRVARVKGLNLGIDFEGGSQVTFETPQPTSVERRPRARSARSAAPTPSSRAAADDRRRLHQFQIKTESLTTRRAERAHARAPERPRRPSRSASATSPASFSTQILRERDHRGRRLARPDRHLRDVPLRVCLRAPDARRALFHDVTVRWASTRSSAGR